MLIDVGEPGRNLVLNACFYLSGLMFAVALVPWRWMGAAGLSRLLRWLPLPSAVLAVVYEVTMPSRFDIRVDLLLLLPMYALIALTSAFRWVRWSRGDAR